METRASLLIRVRDPRDAEAWAEFHELYAPLIYAFARARGLTHDDAEEVRSTCYEVLTRQLPHFEYDRAKGGFKAWLKTIVGRRVVDLLRRRREEIAPSHALREEPARSPDLDELWEVHWRRQHLRHCVEQLSTEVPANQYEAFRLLVHEGQSVATVAQTLDLNANQVYKAKSRMLQLVRERMTRLERELSSAPTPSTDS